MTVLELLDKLDNLAHEIGNPVFAIETNNVYLLSRFQIKEVCDDIQTSLEQIKKVLADLQVDVNDLRKQIRLIS